MTRRARRQPTRREWQQITSSRPVVRRVFRSAPLREAATPLAGEDPAAAPRSHWTGGASFFTRRIKQTFGNE
jgi:hypothetical protein